jgi:hypothetical protein
MNGNSTEAEDLLQKYAGKIENFKSWLTTLSEVVNSVKKLR